MNSSVIEKRTEALRHSPILSTCRMSRRQPRLRLGGYACPLMLGTKHGQTGAVLIQGGTDPAPTPREPGHAPNASPTAAAGDPDPDRRGAGGQRRMGEQQRPAPLTGG
jgi:hypothetical protein